MIFEVLILVLTTPTAIKTINYGRWAGKQGNKRGAFGLYLLALLTVVIPLGIYIFNILR